MTGPEDKTCEYHFAHHAFTAGLRRSEQTVGKIGVDERRWQLTGDRARDVWIQWSTRQTGGVTHREKRHKRKEPQAQEREEATILAELVQRYPPAKAAWQEIGAKQLRDEISADCACS